MGRLGKGLAAVGVLSMLGLLGLIALSRDAPCAEGETVPEGTTSMKAVTVRCYGSAEVLALEDMAKPAPAADEVLVRVHAASINPMEWHTMLGKPYIMRLSAGLGRPSDPRLGVDFAGTVEAVGRDVVRFRPGDEVFGARSGALAEYVTVRDSRIIEPKPPNVSFEEAAAVPLAATTALQAVRDKGGLGPGQRVLVNGASGGVGTYAVQIGKALGGHVTGVSSTRNLELVRSLGADQVIDYTLVDFTRGDERWDVIIDNVGNHPLRAYRRVLAPDGIVVLVGGPKDNPWYGPMMRVLRAAAYSRLVRPTYAPFLAEFRPEDLAFLRELLESGEIRSVLDGVYPMAEIGPAMEYLEQGRSRGKNVILIGPR